MSRDVFVDFGVRKAHAVLIGRSRQVVFVHNLSELQLHGCRIYLERGCPKHRLYGVSGTNRIFLIDGHTVKTYRDGVGLSKTDSNDVFIIRELATKQPSAFRELSRPEREELVDLMAYAYYCKLTSLIASLKNRQRAFVAEFGENLPQLDSTVLELEKQKKHASGFFAKFADRAERLGIRGLGPRYLAGIWIRAHPTRFRSLSAYLSYCGLKGWSVKSGRYSRHVRGLFHQFATSVVMQKDPEFYGLYRRVKRDLALRFPGYPRSRIEGMTKNRLATFLAKRIYAALRSDGVLPPRVQATEDSRRQKSDPRLGALPIRPTRRQRGTRSGSPRSRRRYR